jgi:hypothetical protein
MNRDGHSGRRQFLKSATLAWRWDDDQFGALKRVKGHDFEVVRMGRMVTR